MKSNHLSETDPEARERSIPSVEQLDRLTKREKQVLFWIVEGKTNGDIGRILGISHRTVEKHCESIFRKLGIENRYAAIVCALTNNWQLKPE
ncbi:helix-turn-helix transcriptional regulator [Pelagicoccus sp. SDUM812002]|uniref:response regulator transcription factor n=1 Tax=Pelagicoccus sp. SDUM812002 TaxID=3041266 RepID=UPI00280F589E|nr:helix-turn-helix transcriptional regulator [Pelagicoccus sp. SDUM812002]MDQ8187886.1 helix-turn-helix transcriptional regulator [Pelagicoccus sp. SDUM812002]